MSDTLVDPPPPPTVRDDVELRPKPAPSSKKGCIAAVVVASILTIAGAGALIYFLFFRHEPVAHRHIPGNANLVARASATEIAVFGPVRKHLWPLLFEQAFASAPTQKSPGKTRAQRIQEATGVNLATDVREIIVASVDATSWVVLVGGRIPHGRFVKGMETISREDGWVGWGREGPLLVGPAAMESASGAPGAGLSRTGRIVIGQAEDGTILLGTDTDIVTAALPATEDGARLGLPEEGALTFAMTEQAWSGASSVLGAAVPAGASFRSVARASGRVTLGQSPAIDVRIVPRAGQDAPSLAADIERALGGLRLLLLLAPDVAGEKEAVAGAKVSAEAGVVTIAAPWPYQGLDRACERLAALLRDLRDGSSATPAVAPSSAPR